MPMAREEMEISDMREESLLVIDVGNTNIKLGWYEGENLTSFWRIRTVRDEQLLEDSLSKWFAVEHVSEPDGIVFSSVVPEATRAIKKFWGRWNKKPLQVTPELDLGFTLNVPNSVELGTDRLVDAAGAVGHYGWPLIVVDLGTATTFGILDDKRRYVGGLILPGVGTAMDALARNVPSLPRCEPEYGWQLKTVVGRNTKEALISGIFFGLAGQIDGIVRRIREEFSMPFQVVATGGWAGIAGRVSQEINMVDPLLTLKGLRMIWVLNRKKGS
jgi:type III pantothenate kinase